MTPENKTKMSEVSHGDDEPIECHNKKCKRPIRLYERYYLDTLWDRVYCYQCGLCLRYARKKALERGEPIEMAEIES
jgi:heterodisulfide reductase subunit C